MVSKITRQQTLKRLATWQQELDYWTNKLTAHRRGEQTPPAHLILTNILQYTTALKQLRSSIQRGPYPLQPDDPDDYLSDNDDGIGITQQRR